MDDTVEVLTDEILPLATVTAQNKTRGRIHSFVQMAEGPDLEPGGPGPCTKGIPHLWFNYNDDGGSRVHEPLAENPTISVYKCGFLDENMNILRIGRSEDD